MDPNFWQDKLNSKKVIKEKKLFEDLVNSFENSVKQLNDLNELNELVRADITTKNQQKYKEINEYLDEMEKRIAEVQEKEELSNLRPPISGDDVMKLFDLKPGLEVGKIMKALYEQRLNDGEVSKEEAIDLAESVYKKL